MQSILVTNMKKKKNSNQFQTNRRFSHSPYFATETVMLTGYSQYAWKSHTMVFWWSSE